MEQERLAREAEEKAKAEREKKIKDAFDSTNSQWEKDKSEMQNVAKEANKQKEAQGSKESKAESKDTQSQEKANAGSKDTPKKVLADA